ncbi:MAG: TAT-variant-translocated molybdopterin oxidoreductase [Fimbriimonadales bacterium]|nr:TAT-variant-translocated molybdopterin oxidoreductase [Fimbriimonadales bacterium]
MEETKTPNALDIEEIRRRLRGERGQRYWRSLEEVAETPEFQRFLEDEFPNRSSLLDLDRRSFLKVMGASLALAGLSGCRFLPKEKIVPYVKAPEEVVPGKPSYYATAMAFGGSSIGLIAKAVMGRPIKLEGNESHPWSLGASDVFSQAAILSLYDPDRGATVKNKGFVATWEEFLAEARKTLPTAAGIRLVVGDAASPTLARQIGDFRRVYPATRVVRHEPVGRDRVLRGAQMALGQPALPIYDFSKARVVLALDADFLASMAGSVRYARDFAATRRIDEQNQSPSRLYCVEPAPTPTGILADHRLPVAQADLEGFVRHVAYLVGAAPQPGDASLAGESFWNGLAKDLRGAGPQALVLAGDACSPEVHALVAAIQAKLGCVGSTVRYVAAPSEPKPDQTLGQMVADLEAGKADVVLFLGTNPVYGSSLGPRLAEALGKAKLAACFDLYETETSAACSWYLPAPHFLEDWSDARAMDGTVSIVQPLVEPLHDTMSVHALLPALMNRPSDALTEVRRTWGVDDKTWRAWLNEGVASVPKAPEVPVPAAIQVPPPGRREMGEFELAIRPDPSVWDGRFANNGWLQELPKPFTKLTWDNAVHLSFAAAEALKVSNGDVVKVTLGERSVEGPVWILPGLAKNTVLLHLGYGRRAGGRVAEGAGFDVYPLTTEDSIWGGVGARLEKTGRRAVLASAQTHFSMEGRDIVRMGTLEEYRKKPSLKPEHAHGEPPRNLTLYNDEEKRREQEGVQQWGMAIDLNLCMGCNACVTACQAENNIPVVGKDQVHRGREMHWIRIDHYYGPRNGDGSGDNPAHIVQPVNCQQCENAPCEPVCPVAATVHSHEGLNQMVYNRCVGTRYCSNNCPYKVRRFNYLNYQFAQRNFDRKEDIPLLKLLNNPDVTVRGRGVMEKCTYCVQRINAARIEAKKQGRKIADGEVVTACQQACPSQAIVFGDISDPNSRVSQIKRNQRNYSLLGELNVRPRTTYLARVTNPNPEIEA